MANRLEAAERNILALDTSIHELQETITNWQQQQQGANNWEEVTQRLAVLEAERQVAEAEARKAEAEAVQAEAEAVEAIAEAAEAEVEAAEAEAEAEAIEEAPNLEVIEAPEPTAETSQTSHRSANRSDWESLGLNR